jgi:hypothetical protein
VWIVGVDTDDSAGILRHWDGTKWDDVEVPGSVSLWEVWGTGPGDVWMVGTDINGNGLIERGDGMNFDTVGFQGTSLRSIWGAEPNDVWVAAYDGSIQHWDGTTWTITTGPTSEGSLLGIWGSGAGDLWAVGLKGVALRNSDGKAWTVSNTGTESVLWSVWGASPKEIWAVGSSGTIRLFNGTSWN